MQVAQRDEAARARASHVLAELARLLGSPPRTYTLLGEGGVSLRLDDGTFLIKASGMPLAGVDEQAFVHCNLTRVLAVVHTDLEEDGAVARALARTRVDQKPALRPSLETGMHAVLFAAG